MFTRKSIIAAIGLASAPLIAIIAWQAGQGTFSASKSSPEAGVSEGRTVGDRRLAMLKKLSTQYVASKPEVGPAIAAGKRLAPVPYLNRQLEKNGEAWRVRSVDGLHAETYAVS